MKVLLADDDSLSRRYIENLLDTGGHTYQSFDNGKDAWDVIIQENSPQLLLLDWMMPGLDGMEICQRLSNHPAYTDKYILILSGIHKKTEIAEILSAGADDYMVKPIHEYEFLARVQVAERMISYLNALKRRNQELENLARRYTQMAALESKRQTNEPVTPPAEEYTFHDQSEATGIPQEPEKASMEVESSPTPDAPISGEADSAATESPIQSTVEFSPVALPAFTKSLKAIQALSELTRTTYTSFNLATEITPLHTFPASRYVSWASLYLIKSESWCDLMFEFPDETIQTLTEMLLDNPSDDIEQNCIDTGTQLINLLQGTFRSHLNKELTASQITYAPSAVRLPHDTGYKSLCPHIEGYGFTIFGYPANVFVGVENSSAKRKPVRLVKPFHVLIEPLKSLTQPPVVVAKQWTVLNEESIQSLTSLADAKRIDEYMLSLPPSALFNELYRLMWA